MFPSEENNHWVTIIVMETENTDYEYESDFYRIIESIKKKENDDQSVEASKASELDDAAQNNETLDNEKKEEEFTAEDNSPTTNGMPVMKGSSLSSVMDAANTFGLTQQFSDDDFGHGTKMRSLSSSNGGLTIDIIYSTESAEVLTGTIVTFDDLSSKDEKKQFIVTMSSVLCPEKDINDVTNWVNTNVGSSSETTVNGFVYEVNLGPTGNYLYYAGYRNWEDWETSLY
ncbi:MAG: hypothetical protein IJV14_06235 [Lachnospiraceae bacterium]|nr:hypothetical protein [Lachnospiraceae bacterium]